MSGASTKPVVFISYAHADEPEKPVEGQFRWLSFVQEYLQPAVKGGVFELWVDRQMSGGADWDPEIEQKLRACDIFILLMSARSMASNCIVDKEIAIIRERQKNGEDVYFYALLLTPTPDAGLDKVRDKNLRPRDAKPFSDFSYHERLRHMTEAANEISTIAQQIVERKGAAQPSTSSIQPRYVHISGLPETGYECLVGREVELKRLDEAWADCRTNILSLVGEGGAGKSALVNEWLKRLQADNYRRAKVVLGWSFYNQGSKERATSADEFLNWTLNKLGLNVGSPNADAKGEVIAEMMAKQRVLLVLDGVEPLQQGPGVQTGQLKDLGLWMLLLRFAAMPPDKAHGLIVLTTRLAISDIARWKDTTAPVVYVDDLSDEAGAALLRDNGVWGTDSELKATSHEFGGLPLALGLLASFLKETQFGDVRRRDRIRAFFADSENPRHDHAKRVMESYEKEWLAEQPMLHAIMHIVGLFDRPAAADCLDALRTKPAIAGLTREIVDLNENEWQRAVNRLREARLLAPHDHSQPRALDAHPLVREYFGKRLREQHPDAWRAAHRRLYEHLCATETDKKPEPTLADLQPLYQAVAHGCHAEMHQKACEEIFLNRIWRGDEEYSTKKLGAYGSDLGAVLCFFERPWSRVSGALKNEVQGWLLNVAAFNLRALGRLEEALEPKRVGLRVNISLEDWKNAAIAGSNLALLELTLGEVASAVADAKQAVVYADRSGDACQRAIRRAAYADALHRAGRQEEATACFREAEEIQAKHQPARPLLCAVNGFYYCDLLLAPAERAAWRRTLSMPALTQSSSLLDSCRAVSERAERTLQWVTTPASLSLLSIAHDNLTRGRAALYSAVLEGTPLDRPGHCHQCLTEAVSGLRRAGMIACLTLGLVTRAWLHVITGLRTGTDSAKDDLDEAFEIAARGRMPLVLADIHLHRARLFGLSMGRPANYPWTSPQADLADARRLIEKHGYWRRKEELEDAEAAMGR